MSKGNKKKCIALCPLHSGYWDNKAVDHSYVKNHIGARWGPVFKDIMEKRDYVVMTGDRALIELKAGTLTADDIFVIQDILSPLGKKLIKLGAQPFLLMSMESPLAAYKFYDRIYRFGKQFRHRVLYEGFFHQLPESCRSGNHLLRVPSCWEEWSQPLVPWHDRKFLVMIIRNKYFNKPFKQWHNMRAVISFAKRCFYNNFSSTRKMSIKNELITKRLEAIEYFGAKGRLDLFGEGWDNYDELPQAWQQRLIPILQALKPQPVMHKIEKMTPYKFAICFENVSYPGFITEKIIDCFFAGVIPIYLGAPDIKQRIVEQSFIDMRNFKDWTSLENYLNDMTEEQAHAMIRAGKEFLKSPEGQAYGYEHLAKLIADLF